jgi:hypothetical protein
MVTDAPQAFNDVGVVAMLGGQLKDGKTFFDEAMRPSPGYYALAGMSYERLQLLKNTGKTGR